MTAAASRLHVGFSLTPALSPTLFTRQTLADLCEWCADYCIEAYGKSPPPTLARASITCDLTRLPAGTIPGFDQMDMSQDDEDGEMEGAGHLPWDADMRRAQGLLLR